jgi:indole-3-acetate monooxygenase
VVPAPHAAEVFGNPMGISGGVFAPMGKAVADGDDYVVSGRWAWASGSANCQWLTGGALIFDNGKLRTLPNGGPDHRMMFFRRDEVELIDTWDASGMRGTGSGDMAVNAVRVPRARTVSFITDQPQETGPLYAFPPFGLLALGIAAVASGNARAALDDLRTLATTKKGAGSSRTLAERGVIQADFARGEAQLRAARAKPGGRRSAASASIPICAPGCGWRRRIWCAPRRMSCAAPMTWRGAPRFMRPTRCNAVSAMPMSRRST